MTMGDRIKPDDLSITFYLDNLRRKKYQIPTFQRGVEWDRDKVKRLWDSIYKFYPLGSILVWLTDTELSKHREIGGYPLETAVSGDYQYLLDGQQRTTALLTSVYGGKIKGQDYAPRLYIDLTVEEMDEIEDESWKKRFLFWDEIDDQNGRLNWNTQRKEKYDKGLILKLEDIVHKYGESEEKLVQAKRTYDDPVRQQLRKFKDIFDNYRLAFIELRGIEVAEVCQIFERVNQAGKPLNMFDIVTAKTYRPKSNNKSEFYLRELFDDFKNELNSKGSKYAALDHMTLLQILAVLIRVSRLNEGVRNITPRYLNQLRTEHLEGIWENGKDAIGKVFDFLSNHLHLPGPALIPYRYFYMSLASYFFKNSEPDYDLLKKYFWYYSFHNEDLLRNTTHLWQHVEKLQSAKSGENFEFDQFLIDKNTLRNTTYSSQSRLSRAMLALLANQDPHDWSYLDRLVLTDVYYTLTDQPNLHHVFPFDFCKNHWGDKARYADSLLNIVYLTQITNLHISNKNPLEYIKDYDKPGFADILKAHFVPDLIVDWSKDEEMPDDALDQFIDMRLDLIVEQLDKYLTDIPFEIFDTRGDSTSGNLIV